MRKKHDWIIGFNHLTKRVEIRLNDPRNPHQAEGLTSIEIVRNVSKIPIAMLRAYQRTADIIYWGQR